jgi:hypothetical protein
LVHGEADGSFSVLVGETHLTAELMELRRIAQDKTQAQRVDTLLRQP